MDHGVLHFMAIVKRTMLASKATTRRLSIYATLQAPEHVARQKASGVWISKMGKGHDIEHDTLKALEGEMMGKVVTIMRRPCKDGRRVLE
jgi:hypothetical protein